jgi:hypothetical protein
MATNKNGNFIGTNSLINQSIPLLINSSTGESALIVDSDGNVIVKKLVLLDDKTGRKWEVKISDGEIFMVPLEKSDKRDFKIKKILND